MGYLTKMIGKSGQNGLFRSRFSILGQPPSPSRKPTHSKRSFLNAKGISKRIFFQGNRQVSSKGRAVKYFRFSNQFFGRFSILRKELEKYLCFFLFPLTVSAFEPVSISIDEISYEPWHLEGVVLKLMPSADLSGQQVFAQIERLILPPPIGDLSKFRIRCARALHSEKSNRCQSGDLTAVHSRFGHVKVNFSFDIRNASGKLKIGILQSFLGSGSIVADWQDEQWHVHFNLKKVNVKPLKTFLSGYANFSELEGQVELNGSLKGEGQQVRSFAIEIEAEGLNSQSTNDRLATEATDFHLDIEGQYKTFWRFNGNLSLNRGGLYFDPEAIDPIFIDFFKNPLNISLRGRWVSDSDIFHIDKADFLHDGVVQLSGQGDLNIRSGRLQRGKVKLKSIDLGDAFLTYLAPSLEETDLEGLGMTGTVKSDLTIEGGRLFRFHSVFSGLDVIGKRDRFRLEEGDGELFWQRNGNVPSSNFSWRKALLYRIPMESGQVTFKLERNGLDLNRGADIFLLDGFLHIDSFKLAGISDDMPEVSFKGHLAGISLEKLTEALSWPSLEGEVSGIIPGVSYHRDTLKLDGQLSIQVFDGEVELTGLAISHLLKDLPVLTTTVKLRHIDLAALTRKFSFGSIEGHLDGEIEGLYLENWKPINFNAWFKTPEHDDQRHRISQKAVENITSLGGGPAGILSKGVMRFFDSFAYDRIGVGCRLANGVCEVKGLEAVNGGYYIVKGRSLPRIDIIGYNRRINWNVLLQRLKRVVDSNQPVVR